MVQGILQRGKTGSELREHFLVWEQFHLPVSGFQKVLSDSGLSTSSGIAGHLAQVRAALAQRLLENRAFWLGNQQT